MIITCPRCATRYLLEAGVVRPPGRQVRCARCQHMWFQDPAPDLPTPIPVPVEEPVQSGPITDRSRMLGPPPQAEPTLPNLPRFEVPPPPQSFEPLSVPPEQMTPPQSRYGERRRARSRGMAGLMVVLAALSLFLVIFLSLPNEIATYWPQTASIYNALGFQVNKSGFKIIATQTQELANSIPIIVIKGELINETDRDLPVPSVRIAVRDRNKRELHAWVVRPDQEHVGPRAKGSFSARLESPPADAVDLEVRFAREGER